MAQIHSHLISFDMLLELLIATFSFINCMEGLFYK